jgi:uroporphyrinogen-III synthase
VNPAQDRSPLAGRRILVTRPAGQAGGLTAMIRQAGGEPLEIPALEIRDLADLTSFHAVADQLETYDCAIFVSRNAVRKALALLEQRRGRPWPARLRVAAIGAGSREELVSRGFSGVIAPGGPSDSEALLALPELREVAGMRIAIFRGEGGRALLGETLAARGARVDYAACYRRALPVASGALLAAAWEIGKVDAVLVSSAEGLGNLLEMLGGDGPRRLAGVALFVPHGRVAREAVRLGLGSAIVAGPGDAEMAAALVAYFGGASYN